MLLQLLAALRECAKHVQRGVSGQSLDEVDVGLLALAGAKKGHLKPSQAAAALEVAFPSITRHVRTLQERGLITIAPDEDDGRSYAIKLTPEGETALREYRDGLLTRFAPALTDWPAQELATLADQLTRLAENLTTTLAEANTARTPNWWRTR